MLKKEFQDYLSGLLVSGLKDSVAGSEAGDDWGCELLGDRMHTDEEEFFMLTISSYDLRIFALLQFSRTELTRTYVADALGIPPGELAESRFYDFIGEIGNNFCGTIKRELGDTALHLGMSTPNRLDASSLAWFAESGHAFHQGARISNPEGVTFYGSLCVFAGDDLEINVPRTRGVHADKTVSGALELF